MTGSDQTGPTRVVPEAPVPDLAPLAYRAVPVPTRDRPGPWPGVVLVHDAFGAGDDMHEQADWLAAAGYVVAMPDLYRGRRAVTCLKGTFAQLKAQPGPAFDHIEATRAQLVESGDCTGTVGVIGFCMGGAFALLVANRPGWSAPSVTYGSLPEDLDGALAGACPVVASFGGRDRALPGAAARVRESAERAGVVADVQEYPRAGPGFMNRLTAVSPLTPIMRVSGVGYDHASAAAAKRRILAFLDTHLRGPVS